MINTDTPWECAARPPAAACVCSPVSGAETGSQAIRRSSRRQSMNFSVNPAGMPLQLRAAVTLCQEQRSRPALAVPSVAEDNVLCAVLYLPNKVMLLRDVSLCFVSAV